MGKRQEKLGIKQVIRVEWMDKTLDMVLRGVSERAIRAELKEFLLGQKQSGGAGDRGESSKMAVSVLACWFAPEADLLAFRNACLEVARDISRSQWLPLHWAMICAAYPFWYQVASQVGRLLNLQDLITQAQVFERLKETYGDTDTVSRNARYAVRSLVAWGVVADTPRKGSYAPASQIEVSDKRVAGLVYEGVLLASANGQIAFDALRQSPALFPFEMPLISGAMIGQGSGRVESSRFGVNEEYLRVV